MAKEVPTDTFPEVTAYLQAKEQLDAWIQANEAIIAPLRHLMEQERTTRQAADKVVRANGVLCGPWKKHRDSVSVDAEKLVDMIGLEAFLSIGGTRETEVKYSLAAKTLDLAKARNLVSEETVQAVKTTSMSYSAPKDPSL